MVLQGGYVKIYRSLLANPLVTKDSDHLAVWIYILLHATHTELDAMFEGQRITLKPGQLITGRKVIAGALKIDESKIQRILKSFENAQQIAQQTTPRNRLISVLNWSFYQGSEQLGEQPVNNNCTTTEHKQEGKKEKNSYSSDFESFWAAYPNFGREKSAAFKCWNTRIREGVSPDDLIRAAKAYAAEVQGREKQFVKQGKTFLGPSRPFDDYLNAPASSSRFSADDGIRFV